MNFLPMVCLVLVLELTELNQQRASKEFDKYKVYVYDRDGGPLKPFAMGKSLIAKRPYTYLKYPRLPATTVDSDNQLSVSLDNSGVDDNDSISSAETTNNYSHTSIMAIINSIYFKEVQTKSLFDYGFYTARQIYDDLSTHLPQLHDHATFGASSKMIIDSNFGPRTSVRVNGKPVKGRHLYKIKDILVGYVRKSITKESDKNMTSKLQNHCFCSRAYAFPNSPASKPIMERDFNMNKRNANIVDSLPGCDGNTQQMIHFLTYTTKHIQLCVISYAGLSNRPDDVECFLW
ncbi:hypothetical protein BCV71DRAFT_243302 [Rhizopus microsporus]|uniref:Uncharacterized protein n=1 Tax=Rhizopus microsporus TaxID=58291 RepID=A0A1X0S321_RHIZD|nr:hypothetical protein BCV71DRAFT_243302 [Rhizopus microsporus]